MFAVLLIENPPQYFAKEMAKADELKILRMMVSRSEVRVLICVQGENVLSSNRSLLDDKKANNGLKKWHMHILDISTKGRPRITKKIACSYEAGCFNFLQIDLYYIKKEFLSIYSRQLHDTIDKQCRFDYARLLIVILELRGQYSESAKKR